MPVTVTCTNITKRQNGSILIQWSDGAEQEFGNVQSLQDYALNLDLDPEVARKLFVARWLAQDNEAKSPSLAIDKSLSLDLRSQSAININASI